MRLILLCAFVALSVLPVRAELNYCNQTGEEISAAVGYIEAGEWKSAGWIKLKAAECRPVLTGSLNNRYYYSYAVNADGSRTWGGDYWMCGKRKPFVASGTGNCAGRGFEALGFHQIDAAGTDSFTMNFKQ